VLFCLLHRLYIARLKRRSFFSSEDFTEEAKTEPDSNVASETELVP
jgi:hypothetical protein